VPSFEFNISVKDSSNSNYKIEDDLSGEVSLGRFLKYTKEVLLRISLEALREEQDKGFDKNPIVVVDGNKRKNILDVSPLGRIEFHSTLIVGVDVVKEIYNDILNLSRIDTGQYIESNYVFLNGSRIATNLGEIISWSKTKPVLKSGDLITFINIAPYARKLERFGITSKKYSTKKWVKSSDKKKRYGETVLKPNGTYVITANNAKRKYKQNFKIKFTITSGYSIPGLENRRFKSVHPKASARERANPRAYLYPTIELRIEAGGSI
jgi:hypothetical protein